jgi:hypothetical protein
MLDGLGYLVVQVVVLLAVAVLAGLLAGRYVWPRRRFSPQPSHAAGVPQSSPSAPGGPLTAAGRDEGGERALVAQLEGRLDEAYRRLAQADGEVLQLRERAQALADQNEAEMGRLESGAITALESTIAAHQEQVDAMQARLGALEDSLREQTGQLDLERRRTAQLQAALTERDHQLSALTAGTDPRARTEGGVHPDPGAAR